MRVNPWYFGHKSHRYGYGLQYCNPLQYRTRLSSVTGVHGFLSRVYYYFISTITFNFKQIYYYYFAFILHYVTHTVTPTRQHLNRPPQRPPPWPPQHKRRPTMTKHNSRRSRRSSNGSQGSRHDTSRATCMFFFVLLFYFTNNFFFTV